MKKEKKVKGKLKINFGKLIPLALSGLLLLTGCGKSEKEAKASENVEVDTSVSTTVTEENKSKVFVDEYDPNGDLFTDSNQKKPKADFSKANIIANSTNPNEKMTVYYFDDTESMRLENKPVGKQQENAHDTFEKYESYNLAYRAIEAMDDEFENKYNCSEEDSYNMLLNGNFNVVKSIEKAKSTNKEEKEQAELELSAAKNYYENWLNYNSTAVLDYEENKMKNNYVEGETLKINYFDDATSKKISDKPIDKKDADAYNAFELFASYNLAYRAIEEMDDEYQSKYTFTPEEKYTLISEGFDIEGMMNQTNSSDEKVAEAAKKKLIMAKEYYKNWLDNNDQIVIDYMEQKIK